MKSIALGKLVYSSENPKEVLEEQKNKHGKTIISCFPMYVPEELIHAAGLHPAIIPINSKSDISSANQHIQGYFCGQIRALLELSMQDQLDYVDGIVFCDICEPARLLGQIWRRENITDFVYHIRFPSSISRETSRGYLEYQFRGLRDKLEAFTGREIKNDALEESIRLYNKTRGLLHDLYDLKNRKPGLFTAREFVQICAVAAIMPKEEFNILAAELLEEAKSVEIPSGKKKTNVALWGICGPPPGDLLDLIDQEGGTISGDDLFVGSRYFITRVKEAQKDPLVALVNFQFQQPACTTRYEGPDNDIVKQVLKVAKESESKGVISILHKYCDAQGFDNPLIARSLGKNNISLLTVDLEQGFYLEAQINTRMQAFFEMINE